MGFGAILTTGEKFRPLDGDLMRWIVEARVEQELSKPTIYAIRFEDDLCSGNPILTNRCELTAGKVLGIFVKRHDGWQCLVHGPITDMQTSSMLGGSGSWVEVRGQDRRVEMDRVGIQATWHGKASEAASRVITAYGYQPNCEQTRKEYSTAQDALNQSGTDLDFLEDIRRKNNLELWLTYQVKGAPESFAVTTIFNLRSSPDRSPAPLGPVPLPAPPVLQAPKKFTLRVQPPAHECGSVTRFDAHVDYERPGAAKGFAQAVDTGTTTEQKAVAADAQLAADRKNIVQVLGVDRQPLKQKTALAPPVTDPEENLVAQEGILTEAAWFVTVDCSGTMDLLDFAPEPHQIVDVQYAGDQLSGPYQVMQSTHIINAVDHYVDFKIRANGLRTPEGPCRD